MFVSIDIIVILNLFPRTYAELLLHIFLECLVAQTKVTTANCVTVVSVEHLWFKCCCEEHCATDLS